MNTAAFNKHEKKFLAEYRPEDSMFTSFAEMDRVKSALDLNTKNYTQLSATRNAVVEYYANRMELAGDNKKEVTEHWMPAMQSVTAVIDDIIVRKYGVM